MVYLLVLKPNYQSRFWNPRKDLKALVNEFHLRYRRILIPLDHKLPQMRRIQEVFDI